MSTLTTLASGIEYAIDAEYSVYYVFVYGMDEEAGNEYMSKDFSVSVTVLAKQATGDKDGFGDGDYDNGAEYPATPSTYKDVIANAEDGSTVMLSEGVYDFGDMAIDKNSLSIVGAGAGKTVINNALVLGTNDTVSEGDFEISGVTIRNTAGNTTRQIAISFNGNIHKSGGTVTVRNCEIEGFAYGVQLASDCTGTALNISNTSFKNVFCAVSVKGGNKLEYSGLTFDYVAYQYQTWGDDAEKAAGYYKTFGDESPAEGVANMEAAVWTKAVWVNDTYYATKDADNLATAIAAVNAADYDDTQPTVILLNTGVYTATANEKWSVTADNVTLQGMGEELTVIDGGTYSVSGQAALFISGDNCTVCDLTVKSQSTDGNVAAIKAGGDNFKIENVTVYGSDAGVGLNIHGTNENKAVTATVNRVTIVNWGKVGLSVAQANVTLTDSVIMSDNIGWGSIGVMWADKEAYKYHSTLTVGEGNVFVLAYTEGGIASEDNNNVCKIVLAEGVEGYTVTERSDSKGYLCTAKN